MRGYDRYEYEDLDEYEEDGEELEEQAGEEKYEEEEAPQPTKEVLDYLELRQRLKEEKRKKFKKDSGPFNAASHDKKNLIANPKDNYGSFFGPSQPVIAQRVIQESKSLLENPNLAARVIKSNRTGNKSSGSAPVGSKSQANGQRPKVSNGLQTKVQVLKNTRDYSFLLSDDADVPAQRKDPPARNVFAPKSEARSAQLQERSKDSFSSNGKRISSSGEDRKPTPAGSRVQPKSGTERFASADKHNRTLVDSRKQSAGRNGTLSDPRKQLSGNNGTLLDPRKHLSGSNGTLSDPRKQLACSNGTSADPKKQFSSNNGSGPGRPVMSKGMPSKISGGTAEKKVAVPAAKMPTSGMHKPAPSKLLPPVSKQSLLRKGEGQESRMPKALPKQVLPPSKAKVTQPPVKNSTRATSADDRPRKRPRHDDDDEDPEHAISLIRQMFGYNPRRYEDVDDDSDMEANFDDIMREEKRSAKIAREEDEEELRKIEEEERRERMRKDAKRGKLNQR